MLRVPGQGLTGIPVYEPRIPKVDELALLPAPCLRCSVAVGKALKGIGSMWGVGGDAGLVMHGVAVRPDHLEIVTTKEGADDVFSRLSKIAREPVPSPVIAEKRLSRDAEINGNTYPVNIRSYYSELVVENVKVEVYGDKQFKVGEWDWGDPIEFKPDLTQVVDTDVLLVPIKLESEISFGLGWSDVSRRIAEAIARQKHSHMMVQGSMDE